jgi:GDPmannose 4,6-dehydratase
VELSFEQPAETIVSTTLGTLNILEAMRIVNRSAKLYNASSSESFGDLNSQAADESFPFKPRSPYGVAKAAAHSLAVNYRERHGLFCSNGILVQSRIAATPSALRHAEDR